LRTKWIGLHTDETYFRDSVHGFLAWAWALAALVAIVLLSLAISSIVSGGMKIGAQVVGGVAEAAAAGAASAATIAASNAPAERSPLPYFTDKLFRWSPGDHAAGAPAPVAGSSDARAHVQAAEQAAGVSKGKVLRIFTNNIGTGNPLPPEDVSYVGELVAQRTGLSQLEAEKRVTDSYAQLQTGLDNAKKTAQIAVDNAREASAQRRCGFSSRS
jgi:hypothetical protein